MTGLDKTVGRFAPSPTGPLHFGSLVAAVGSYVLAKRGGGKWLLRIEDIDTPRVVPGAADDILRTLDALGLHWDGPAVFQSKRLPAYEQALETLLGRGLVYPCDCSRAEVALSSSAPHPGEDGPVYPGICRNGPAHGRPARAFRVRVDSEPIAFEDGIHGLQQQILSQSVGDFVVRRGDGPFAYQLSVVVDDAQAGVTQVARGADLLSSTARQIYLQRLLGLPTPAYFHLPLICGPDGGKLSKRDCGVSLPAGRPLGRMAGDLVLRTLRALGQSPPGDLIGAPPEEDLRWAAAHFSLNHVPVNPLPFPSN